MVVIAAKQKELNINGTIQKPLKEAESPIGSLAELDKKLMRHKRSMLMPLVMRLDKLPQRLWMN